MFEKILITGASGLLGNFLCMNFYKSSKVVAISHKNAVNHPEVREIKADICEGLAFTEILNREKPEIIIHSAGLTSIEQCENEPQLAQKVHVDATENILNYAIKSGCKLVHISTDHLWNGKKGMINEDEPLNPINEYGRSKAKAEVLVSQNLDSALIIRTNFFGLGLPWRKSISDWIIESLKRQEVINAFADVFFTPISLYHLVTAIEILIKQSKDGIYHIVGSNRVSKYEFAIAVARIFQLNENLIHAGSLFDMPNLVKRPLDMSLSSKKYIFETGCDLPSLEESITSLLKKEGE